MNVSGPILSRRSFLALSASALAARIVIPAFSPPRGPYVAIGESVSYIGLELHPAPTFIGSTLVRGIDEWDGVGYPCTLYRQSPGDAVMLVRFYDSDLCNFLREVPERFWSSEERRRRYKNVHTFVRERRFGEYPTPPDL